MTMTAPTTENKQLEHIVASELLSRPVRVMVVGCGGTGSAIAGGLPYLHQAMLAHGHPGGLEVTLVDADRISETNCVRQPFSISEVGLYKATVLANRANLFWGLGWQAINTFFDEKWSESTDILISCVDTRAARNKIVRSDTFQKATYLLDIGNNADTGQFVLGQPPSNHETGLRLPSVHELLPEIIDSTIDRKDLQPSCSAVEALTKQEPFVNQMLAYAALALLAKLFRYGRLTYHGGFVNLATGKVQPIAVNPAVWAPMMAGNRRTGKRRKVA